LHAVEIVGSPGPDTVSGTVSGPETLYGSAGDDTFMMSPGVKSVVRGGPGADTLDYSQYPHGVGVSLARLGHVSIENVTGTSFADRLIGDGGANVLSGGAGDDVLSGGPGADT